MTYYTPDQWRGTSLGKAGRDALRAAVGAHAGWPQHRADLGLSHTGDLTTAELINVALALSIDIAAVTGRTPDGAAADAGEHHKPRPHGADEVQGLKDRYNALAGTADGLLKLGVRSNDLCRAILTTIHDKQDGRATEKQFATIARILDRAENRASSTADASNDTASTTTTATTESASMTAHVPPAAATDAASQLAGLIAQLAGSAINPETVARIVDERINAALASVPSVKIECKGVDQQTRAIDGHQHAMLKPLLTAAGSRDASGFHPSIWITGPAGSGKTHGAKTVAHAFGLSFHFNGALANAFELLGFVDAGGTYHRTAFREAYENGGLYLYDEVDGSDNSALLALNAALANGQAQFPDKQVKRHPDSIIIATANTFGLGATADYVGRARIDAAFLDRFGVTIFWDYDVALEVAISGNEKFARRVIAARERARAAGLKVLITPRASIAGAALIAAGVDEDTAATMTYLARLNPDQRKIVEGR